MLKKEQIVLGGIYVSADKSRVLVIVGEFMSPNLILSERAWKVTEFSDCQDRPTLKTDSQLINHFDLI